MKINLSFRIINRGRGIAAALLLFFNAAFFSPLFWRGEGGEAVAQSGQKFSTGLNSLSGSEALGSSNNFPLIIKTNGTEWMRITETGNVGVGTTVPQGKLEVRGNVFAIDEQGILHNRGFVAYQNNNGTQGVLFSGYKSRGTHAAPTSVLSGDFGFAYANTFHGSSQYINSGALVFSVDGPVIGNSVPSQIEFITSAMGNEGSSNYGHTRMIIKSDGKIGVGTFTPTEKLTVEGTIQSTLGGFKFPDGSVQTTATTDNNVFDSIHVVDRIKVGNTLFIDGLNSPLPHSIYTNNASPFHLFIQSNSSYSNNTIINANNSGKVGIGTTDPKKKLHIVTTHTACALCPTETHEGIRLEDQTYFSGIVNLV